MFHAFAVRKELSPLITQYITLSDYTQTHTHAAWSALPYTHPYNSHIHTSPQSTESYMRHRKTKTVVNKLETPLLSST